MNRVYAENVIEKIVSAERSAAEIMMHAHDIIAESKSGQRDIVTEYDKRVQEYLMQVLSESVPEARFSARSRRSMTISMQGICLLSTHRRDDELRTRLQSQLHLRRIHERR